MIELLFPKGFNEPNTRAPKVILRPDETVTAYIHTFQENPDGLPSLSVTTNAGKYHHWYFKDIKHHALVTACSEGELLDLQNLKMVFGLQCFVEGRIYMNREGERLRYEAPENRGGGGWFTNECGRTVWQSRLVCRNLVPADRTDAKMESTGAVIVRASDLWEKTS